MGIFGPNPVNVARIGVGNDRIQEVLLLIDMTTDTMVIFLLSRSLRCCAINRRMCLLARAGLYVGVFVFLPNVYLFIFFRIPFD